MSNYPAGVTTSDLPGERGHYVKTDVCCICAAELEFCRSTGKWEFSNGRIATVHALPKSDYVVCSQKCLSQHVWNSSDVADREVLNDLARVSYLWTETTDAGKPAWLLKHSRLSLLIDPLLLRVLDTELHKLFLALADDDEPPTWFLNAVKELAL